MAEEWWRQNNDASLASYLFHVNSGCEANDHTFWSMTNEGYAFKTNHSALVCCHSGPANCFCDFYFYTIPDGRCLTANYADNTITAKPCNFNVNHHTPAFGLWSETYYNE